MSPALIDTGASPQNPLPNKGQISSPSPVSPRKLFGFISNDQIASSFSMNSYSQSGFENSSGMNSNFEFSSSATSKLDPEKPLLSSFSSLSRPRMAKTRKSLSSRSMGGSITGKMDPSFNQFHRVSDTLTGVSSSLDDDEVSMNRSMLEVKNKAEKHGNAFIEVTGKLKVETTSDSRKGSRSGNHMNEGGSASLRGNQQHSKGVEKSLPSELPVGMKKLNLGGSHGESSMMYGVTRDDIGGNCEASSGFISSGRYEVGLSGATFPTELPNDFEKLNLMNTGEVVGCNFVSTTATRRDFIPNSIRKNKDTIAPGITSTLPEKIKNLNIEDSYKSNVVEKDMNANKNNKAFDSGSAPVTDPMVLDKVEGSNIGDCSERSSDHSHPDSFSFLRKGGMESTSKDASGDSNHMTFASPIKEHTYSSGPQVFVSHSNRGSELHSTSASSTSTFQSVGPKFQLLRDELQNLCTHAAEKKGGFCFSGNPDSLRVPHVQFRSSDSKCNLISGSNQEIEFSDKKGSVKDTLLKGRKGKPKEYSSVSLGKSFLPNNFEAYSEPSESSSSMDVFPYQENHEEIQLTREPSLTSDDQMSNDSRASFCSYAEEDIVTASDCIDINKGNDIKHDDAKTRAGTHEDSMSAVENHDSWSLKDSMVAFESQNFRSAYENMEISGEKEAESNSEGQSSDGTQYFSASSSLSSGTSSFTFAASPSAQGQASASIRYQKKKNRTKAGLDIYIPTRTLISDAAAASQFPPISRVSLLLSPVGQKDGVSNAPHKGDSNLKATCSTSKTIGGVNCEDTKREVLSQTSSSCAAQEACEKCRLRGNQAYSSGHLEKAEDCYTQGLSCIPQNETSWQCLRALVLCYSNRAATRMCLRRVREALQDCLVASELDPNFFKVQLRAANCYLALGEVGDASRYFQKLLKSTDVCVEKKLIQEASDGIKKAQKVSETMDRSTELLQGAFSDVEAALGVIADALVISPYSELLLERKAEALFMLQRYEEVIQLCTQTLESAEKNSSLFGVIGQHSNLEFSELLKNYNFQIWRYRLIFKSNFHLGKLEESLDFLENQEQWRSMVKNYGDETLQSLIPELSTARELIHLKSAGNEAFQAGRHTEAVEHYSAALSLNVESRSFAAVCFGNRAAAYQVLGQITDAIADCSLAIALDGNYLKAISRRATLYEMIRDYEQAAKDLQRLLSLLAKQAEGKANQSVSSSAASSLAADLRQARQRLYQMEEQAKKGLPLNFYLILEVEPSVTTFDLKKAYRKAALKHHPDKASQSLARSEGGDEGFWKEIAEEVHKDADRLFKMVGEAYAVISDPMKRSQYNIEEEIRTGQRKSSSSTTSRMHTDAPSNSSDRSGYDGGRKWREAWRFSGNPYNQGFEPTGSSRR